MHDLVEWWTLQQDYWSTRSPNSTLSGPVKQVTKVNQSPSGFKSRFAPSIMTDSSLTYCFSPVSLAMDSDQQTLRVAGLPSKTQTSDVQHFFADRIKRNHGRQIVEVVGPICDHSSRITKRTTVSFSSTNTAQKALNLEETSRQLMAEHGGREIITLDNSFQDLTTLHASNNPKTGKPDIE